MFSILVACNGKFDLCLISDGHLRILNAQGSVLKVIKNDAFKSVSFDIFSRSCGISKQFLIFNDSKMINDLNCNVFKLFDSGKWAVRGTVTGQVSLFKILNDQGHLVKSWDGHFNSVNCISVPINEHGFYTAGNDGSISYYSLASLETSSWNAHSAPILDLHLSRGIYLDSLFIWSLSLDKKCKMWDSKGNLVKSWDILELPTTFTVNSLETWIFFGTNTGTMYGISTSSTQNLVDAESCPLVFKSNDTIPISSMALSLDERHLISGDKAGVIKFWDLESHVCFFSLSFQGTNKFF